MTLYELIRLADAAYDPGVGTGLVLAYHEEPTEDHGDGLARFIASELKGTYDERANDYDQLDEALRVMTKAREQLQDVEEAFDVVLENYEKRNQ